MLIFPATPVNNAGIIGFYSVSSIFDQFETIKHSTDATDCESLLLLLLLERVQAITILILTQLRKLFGPANLVQTIITRLKWDQHKTPLTKVMR